MKVYYGKVSHIRDANVESCKCFVDDASLYVGESNIFWDIRDYWTYRYYILPELIPGVEEGVYEQFSPDYEEIYNHCVKGYLENSFNLEVETMYKGVCYSEWTCGYASEVTVKRLGELKELEGKIVAFFI